LAETFLHLIDSDENIAIKKIENVLKKYETKYKDLWLKMMKSKIGINQDHEKDKNLIKELLDLMQIYKLDYTNTFTALENNGLEKYSFMNEWISKLNLRKKINKNEKENKYFNPNIIPRNHIIENVINECKVGNYKKLKIFISLLKNPYNSNIPEEFSKEPSNEERVYETFCGT
jgi:uncharacterized protein YdiU (UPF0061 family)